MEYSHGVSTVSTCFLMYQNIFHAIIKAKNVTAYRAAEDLGIGQSRAHKLAQQEELKRLDFELLEKLYHYSDMSAEQFLSTLFKQSKKKT